MSCAGILLTGGAGRRVGRDKANIVWQGETLAVRAARVLAEVCDPVVEVGTGATSLPSVREDPPGSGPLAALVAGALAVTAAVPGWRGPVVLLACDLPFVTAPVLRLLADRPGASTVIPVVDGREQYACARYGPDALDRARAALRSGERSLRAVAAGEWDPLTEGEWGAVAPSDAFADVDTPEDLRRLGLS